MWSSAQWANRINAWDTKEYMLHCVGGTHFLTKGFDKIPPATENVIYTIHSIH